MVAMKRDLRIFMLIILLNTNKMNNKITILFCLIIIQFSAFGQYYQSQHLIASGASNAQVSGYNSVVSVGEYAVSIKVNANGYSGVIGFLTPDNNLVTSIYNKENNIEANIFPNPNNGICTLELKNKNAINNYSIVIYNIIGEAVLTKNNCLPLEKIDITNLANGLYKLLIEGKDSNQEMSTLNILKQSN